MTRPPSQAVIEAVEQAMCRLVHGEDWTVPVALPDSSDPRNRVAACYSCQRNGLEVARAAEAAALRAAAERMDDLSRGTPLAAAITARAAAKRLDHWADELTDTDHFEAMSNAQFWIGVDFDDGTKWSINCGAVNPNAKGYAFAEQDSP